MISELMKFQNFRNMISTEIKQASSLNINFSYMKWKNPPCTKHVLRT